MTERFDEKELAKKKKFLDDKLEDMYDRFSEVADVNMDSDIPISEKKAKEKFRKQI